MVKVKWNYYLCFRKKPDDGKGKYKSANTPLRRWGTVVRAHTQPASSQRDRTNGHVTGSLLKGRVGT